jgi:hypothetical protein
MRHKENKFIGKKWKMKYVRIELEEKTIKFENNKNLIKLNWSEI